MRSFGIRIIGSQRTRRGASQLEYAFLLATLSTAVIGGAILAQKGLLATFGNTGALGNASAQTGNGQGSGGGGTSQSSGGQVLFQDDFNGNNSSQKWLLEGATWAEKGEALQVGYPWPQGEQRACAQGLQGGNLAIKMDATMFSGDGYGIIFRATGDLMTGYTFQYDHSYNGGEFIIRKWVNGYEIWPPFAAANPPPGFSWFGVDHQIELDAQGSSFTAKVDGQAVLTAQDSSYQSGGVGIRAWDSTQATFDSFSVTQLGN